jgi:hypothetical protein
MKKITDDLYAGLYSQFKLELFEQLEANAKFGSPIKDPRLTKLDWKLSSQIYRRLCLPLHLQIVNNI